MTYKKTRHVTTIGLDYEVAEEMRKRATEANMSRLDYASTLLAEAMAQGKVIPARYEIKPAGSPPPAPVKKTRKR